MATTRRTVLRSALGAALAAATPLARAASIEARTVANGITLLEGAGGNVLGVTTADGLVVVDSGRADASQDLLAALAKLAGGTRVHTLFNTHWHREQIGGNELLGSQGAAIVAHEKTRLRLATGYYVPAEDRYEQPMPRAAQPTQSFYTTGESTIGRVHVDYGYLLEAHTDGDCYVRFPEADIVAVGDVVSPLRDPELDWFGGGWIGGRLDALDRLLALGGARTQYVPSYGPLVGRAAVQAERDMLLALYERFFTMIRKGMSADDMLAAGVMNDTGRQWRDATKFVHDVHRGLWAHHNTLSPDIV
jgi:glyoxylase-like metal-dependent hydrolase (beta-lactamase superfamily II)